MTCMVKNLPTANFILRGKSEKYTKENMLVEHFGSHFSQNGPFNLISWPHCHIFDTLSIDTHFVYSDGHMAIWLYDHMAIIWPYGYTAIWLYGSECCWYGCLWKEHSECSNLVKKLNWLHHSGRNESQKAPLA